MCWCLLVEMKQSLNMNENRATSSPIRVRFSDVTNKKIQHQDIIDDDRRWKLLGSAPAITIDNDDSENDAWTECRELFEANQSHMLNPSLGKNNNYLLRHSSANSSLNESSSLDALAGNAGTSLDGPTDDLFSIIEQAGITLDALTRSSSGDLLASTSGYHSYEPSPFNHRLKNSSALDPTAAEFSLEHENIFTNNSQTNTNRLTEHSHRRSSRTQPQTPLRYPTSCKITIKFFPLST